MAKSCVSLRMAVGLGALFEGFVYRRLFTGVAMVNSVNMRSTAWPLSHMCNVTANQRSTVKLSVTQCSAVRGELQHGGESDCCRLRLPELYI